jgi:hypothetical protein
MVVGVWPGRNEYVLDPITAAPGPSEKAKPAAVMADGGAVIGPRLAFATGMVVLGPTI